MKRIALSALLFIGMALAVYNHKRPQFKTWELLQNKDGTYGYIKDDGTISYGYTTCEQAKASRDFDLAWEANWKADGVNRVKEFRRMQNVNLWKSANCQ